MKDEIMTTKGLSLYLKINKKLFTNLLNRGNCQLSKSDGCGDLKERLLIIGR
jgi:hypothetical protein